MKPGTLFYLAFCWSLLIVSGCSPGQIRRDIVIDQVIKEARIRGQQAVRQNPNVFAGIEVSREGDDTVVLEYVLKPAAELKVSEIRDEYVNALKNDAAARKDFQRIADEGIKIRLIYKNTAGETVDDFRVNPNDY